MWRGKKQVLFIHMHLVSSSRTAGLSHQVRRSMNGKKRHFILNAPQLQKDHASNINAVDQNNCGSADYSTSVRTTQWYLHLFCWALDHVIHVVYVVVYMYNKSIGSKDWKQFARRNCGRGDFQVALGIALINHAIVLEWTDKSQQKADRMHQSTLIPYECKQCYFCLNNMTRGIYHHPEKITCVKSDGKTMTTSGCIDECVNPTGKSASYC